jgi:hypothetical protein
MQQMKMQQRRASVWKLFLICYMKNLNEFRNRYEITNLADLYFRYLLLGLIPQWISQELQLNARALI